MRKTGIANAGVKLIAVSQSTGEVMMWKRKVNVT